MNNNDDGRTNTLTESGSLVTVNVELLLYMSGHDDAFVVFFWMFNMAPLYITELLETRVIFIITKCHEKGTVCRSYPSARSSLAIVVFLDRPVETCVPTVIIRRFASFDKTFTRTASINYATCTGFRQTIYGT